VARFGDGRLRVGIEGCSVLAGHEGLFLPSYKTLLG
jgi:hypothetical protein